MNPQGMSSNLGIFSLLRCLKTCQDQAGTAPRLGTRVWNLSDRPIELQIRVGSILRKVHTVKPGCSKRVKSKSIYKAYINKRNNVYYHDDTCLPYVWIHDTGGNFSRMVKQQYISLEDLRDCSEIRIYRDHQRGCISVRKKPRVEFC